MKKHSFCWVLSACILFGSCKENKQQLPVIINSDSTLPAKNDSGVSNAAVAAVAKPADFVPAGYTIFETVNGDINNDQVPDCILIIKGTDKKNIVKDEYKGELDRNRRGIIVLLNKNGGYEQLVKNYNCFSSENEDGGVYFAPELSVEVKKGNLQVNYGHGRYGYWGYTFRATGNDMELVGYDASSNTGPVTDRETSINFLTKKKKVRENTNHDAEPGEEVFRETWSTIKLNAPILLSAVKDFDEMGMYEL